MAVARRHGVRGGEEARLAARPQLVVLRVALHPHAQARHGLRSPEGGGGHSMQFLNQYSTNLGGNSIGKK